MGQQIIKKDDGKYAIWSTIVDDFLVDYATKEEIIEYLREKTLREFDRDIEQRFEMASTHQRRTYNELMDLRNEVHEDNYGDGFDKEEK